MTWPGRRQVGRFVWARNSTAFGIDRSASGILVLATRVVLFLFSGGQRGYPGSARVRSASLVFVRARKKSAITAIEKVREGLSRKLTGPALK